MSSSNSHPASLTNHKASVYRENANFVYSEQFTNPLLDLLEATPGQRIVDLGCGSGELTAKLGQLVGAEGLVMGIDSSPDMVRSAIFWPSFAHSVYVVGEGEDSKCKLQQHYLCAAP